MCHHVGHHAVEQSCDIITLETRAWNLKQACLMQMQVANCSMNALYAHAAAVKQFRKIVPGGKISMNLNAEWSVPFDSNNEQDLVMT